MDGRAITADAAGTWTLGDLTVNRIGFGAMRLTRNADGRPGSRERAVAVLRRALDLGVNHIDTAAFCFSPLRSANELISAALARIPGDLVITTKVWPGRDPSGEWVWASPRQLRGQDRRGRAGPGARPPGTRGRAGRGAGPRRERRAGPAGLDAPAGTGVLAIPGTGNPDHLEANVAAGAPRLAPEEMARLDG